MGNSPIVTISFLTGKAITGQLAHKSKIISSQEHSAKRTTCHQNTWRKVHHVYHLHPTIFFIINCFSFLLHVMLIFSKFLMPHFPHLKCWYGMGWHHVINNPRDHVINNQCDHVIGRLAKWLRAFGTCMSRSRDIHTPIYRGIWCVLPPSLTTSLTRSRTYTHPTLSEL